MRLIGLITVVLTGLLVNISYGAVVTTPKVVIITPQRVEDSCTTCIVATCTNKRMKFNAKKTYCCQPEVIRYASYEIDCIRHDADRDGLCYQHGMDWNICVDLMRNVFCKGDCVHSPIPQDINIPQIAAKEDIYHRVDRTGHFDAPDVSIDK